MYGFHIQENMVKVLDVGKLYLLIVYYALLNMTKDFMSHLYFIGGPFCQPHGTRFLHEDFLIFIYFFYLYFAVVHVPIVMD